MGSCVRNRVQRTNYCRPIWFEQFHFSYKLTFVQWAVDVCSNALGKVDDIYLKMAMYVVYLLIPGLAYNNSKVCKHRIKRNCYTKILKTKKWDTFRHRIHIQVKHKHKRKFLMVIQRLIFHRKLRKVAYLSDSKIIQ